MNRGAGRQRAEQKVHRRSQVDPRCQSDHGAIGGERRVQGDGCLGVIDVAERLLEGPGSCLQFPRERPDFGALRQCTGLRQLRSIAAVEED